jgi:hypothetical protein
MDERRATEQTTAGHTTTGDRTRERVCPVCVAAFLVAGRRTYCSMHCARQVWWRRSPGAGRGHAPLTAMTPLTAITPRNETPTLLRRDVVTGAVATAGAAVAYIAPALRPLRFAAAQTIGSAPPSGAGVPLDHPEHPEHPEH